MCERGEILLSDLTDKWKIDYEETAELVKRGERGMYQELRGRGNVRVYRHSLDGQTLALSTENERKYRKLSLLPYMQVKNDCVLLFPLEYLDAVAQLVGVRKKRHLTPAQKKAASQRLMIARQTQKQAA